MMLFMSLWAQGWKKSAAFYDKIAAEMGCQADSWGNRYFIVLGSPGPDQRVGFAVRNHGAFDGKPQSRERRHGSRSARRKTKAAKSTASTARIVARRKPTRGPAPGPRGEGGFYAATTSSDLAATSSNAFVRAEKPSRVSN